MEPALAFATENLDPPALEIRVNFGVFAGRAATAAEIDELAAAMLPLLRDVTIVGEDRHEIGEDVEASIHQVRIEVDADHLPPPGPERERLVQQLVDAAEAWAEACIAERHAEITEL